MGHLKWAMSTIRERYDALRAMGLKLDLTRGQPGDDNFDVSNPMLTIVDDKSLVTPSGVALRNYPGGIAGLKEARELFAPVLGVQPDEIIVGNNASLALLGNVLMWAMLKGVPGSPAAWGRGEVKCIVTVPGYDRHFLMLERLGITMVPVGVTADGPDIAAIERLAGSDSSVKSLLFVPTYSNPTGDTTSQAIADRLGAMKTAAPFTTSTTRRRRIPTFSARRKGRDTPRAWFFSDRHPRSPLLAPGSASLPAARKPSRGSAS
jgi:DNA-binding transcriptional MocR family regulator